MKLLYRSHPYHTEPSNISAIETETIAKYRGVAYRVRRPAATLEMTHRNLNLVYRGVAYNGKRRSSGKGFSIPGLGLRSILKPISLAWKIVSTFCARVSFAIAR